MKTLVQIVMDGLVEHPDGGCSIAEETRSAVLAEMNKVMDSALVEAVAVLVELSFFLEEQAASEIAAAQLREIAALSVERLEGVVVRRGDERALQLRKAARFLGKVPNRKEAEASSSEGVPLSRMLQADRHRIIFG